MFECDRLSAIVALSKVGSAALARHTSPVSNMIRRIVFLGSGGVDDDREARVNTPTPARKTRYFRAAMGTYAVSVQICRSLVIAGAIICPFCARPSRHPANPGSGRRRRDPSTRYAIITAARRPDHGRDR